MANRCIPLQLYVPLHSSDDLEATDTPKSRWINYFALRRVRTIIIAGALLAIVILLMHFVELPAELHHVSHNTTESSPHPDQVDWSNFAYAQYVTNENYLCNSLMMLEALHRFGAKADRLVMFPHDWQIPEDETTDAPKQSQLLGQARNRYGARLVPIEVQSVAHEDPTWQNSYTKLLAFNQTQYKRVMSLDSDATLRDHMDELFLLPSTPVAMPRAYWLDQPFLSSQLVLLEPSLSEWQRMQMMMTHEDSGFDMDILNTLYKDSSIIIPHRRYNMLSAEFRSEDHTKYLGSSEEWNGTRMLEEAKFVHFSDWPVKKPWLKVPDTIMAENQPKCKDGTKDRELDCTDRDIWLDLYADFAERRLRICGRSYDEE